MGDLGTGHGGWPPRSSTGGASTVFVNGIPVHREGDSWPTHCKGNSCHDSSLAKGSSTVFAEGQGIARIGDPVACGSAVANASGNVFCDDKSPSVQIVPGEGFFPSDRAQIEPKNAESLIEETSGNAVCDEPEEEELAPIYQSRGFPAPTAPPSVETPTQVSTDVENPNTDFIDSECGGIQLPLDYGMMLSPNVPLSMVSTKAIFPHTVKAQAGLSLEDIICNLVAVANNILEPMIDEYGFNRVNSGFRTMTKGTSQHEKGMAVDLQMPGAPPEFYTDVCRWILDNLNFDTLGIEMGRSVWLHITFDRTAGSNQRRRIFTYNPNISPRYQFGTLINYQDSRNIIV
jgi:uncharacterized Zn-binding protein involved in type VI secretion